MKIIHLAAIIKDFTTGPSPIRMDSEILAASSFFEAGFYGFVYIFTIFDIDTADEPFFKATWLISQYNQGISYAIISNVFQERLTITIPTEYFVNLHVLLVCL